MRPEFGADGLGSQDEAGLSALGLSPGILEGLSIDLSLGTNSLDLERSKSGSMIGNIGSGRGGELSLLFVMVWSSYSMV